MKAIIVAGLGFGDEGKGSIVDSLVRRFGAGLVVRYNGGAQSAHNVVLPDGRHHCFSQFGSGTLAGARTHLSRYMMIDPVALINEAKHLQELGIPDPFSLLTIDPNAPILTPYHVAMNCLREIARGKDRHGSCGRGIGELASDIISESGHLTAWDLFNLPSQIYPTVALKHIRDRYLDQMATLDLPSIPIVQHYKTILEDLRPTDWLNRLIPLTSTQLLSNIQLATRIAFTETTIFEGAQGVLLDQKYGFHPYTTWSDCTYGNAHKLLEENEFNGDVLHLGVIRSFMTRHGAGPFPTESRQLLEGLKDHDHNTFDQWQGQFRVGYFDLALLRYALAVCDETDFLALTHVDKLQSPCWIAESYSGLELVSAGDLEQQEKLTKKLSTALAHYRYVRSRSEFIEILEDFAKPIGVFSTGPTANDKAYEMEML